MRFYIKVNIRAQQNDTYVSLKKEKSKSDPSML